MSQSQRIVGPRWSYSLKGVLNQPDWLGGSSCQSTVLVLRWAPESGVRFQNVPIPTVAGSPTGWRKIGFSRDVAQVDRGVAGQPVWQHFEPAPAPPSKTQSGCWHHMLDFCPINNKRCSHEDWWKQLDIPNWQEKGVKRMTKKESSYLPTCINGLLVRCNPGKFPGLRLSAQWINLSHESSRCFRACQWIVPRALTCRSLIHNCLPSSIRSGPVAFVVVVFNQDRALPERQIGGECTHTWRWDRGAEQEPRRGRDRRLSPRFHLTTCFMCRWAALLAHLEESSSG